MGHGLSWICPNCGYEFSAQLGFGFRYPWVCHQLIQKARAGSYGAEWQDLVETYPGTCRDGDLVLRRCENSTGLTNTAARTAAERCAPYRSKKFGTIRSRRYARAARQP